MLVSISIYGSNFKPELHFDQKSNFRSIIYRDTNIPYSSNCAGTLFDELITHSITCQSSDNFSENNFNCYVSLTERDNSELDSFFASEVRLVNLSLVVVEINTSLHSNKTLGMIVASYHFF